MPVLVTAEGPGQTRQGYDGLRAALEGILRQTPGLVLHSAYVVDGGLRVIEIWESAKEANDFLTVFDVVTPA